MKKLFKLGLVGLMIFTFVGCSKEKPLDPKETFLVASEKTNALEKQSMDIEVSIELMGMTVSMPIKSKIVQKDGIVQSMYMDMNAMESTQTMTFVDGYMYMNVDGTTVKCAMTIDDFMEMNGGTIDYSVENDAIETVEFGEVDDEGNQTCIITINTEAMNEMAVTTGLVEEGQSVEYTNFSYTAVINKDGYISELNIVMEMKVTVQGVSVDSKASISTSYNIGEDFEITAPADADSYVEYNLEDLQS